MTAVARRPPESIEPALCIVVSQSPAQSVINDHLTLTEGQWCAIWVSSNPLSVDSLHASS
jgi:hypothetical protein